MIKNAFERLLFASRFLLTPLYLALAVSLLALLAKAGLHLYHLLPQLPTLDDEEVLLSELAIVDMTLTASLVVIVFLSGYTNFVAPVVMREGDGRPHWIAEIDFSELKLKLMASIVAISAIKLLEGFMDIAHKSDRELWWLAGIHLTFVVSAVLLALADRLGHRSARRPTTAPKASEPPSRARCCDRRRSSLIGGFGWLAGRSAFVDNRALAIKLIDLPPGVPASPDARPFLTSRGHPCRSFRPS